MRLTRWDGEQASKVLADSDEAGFDALGRQADNDGDVLDR